MAGEESPWMPMVRGGRRALLHAAEVAVEPSSLSARFFALGVLSSEPIKGLTFGLPYCTIDPSIFTDVRAAILRGGIRMRVMGPGDPDFHVAQAVYMPDDDIMKICEGDWEKQHRFRTAIVHECVHAHHDMEARSDLRVYQTETAAYMAETVYARCWEPYAKTEIQPSFMRDPNSRTYTEIFRHAWRLAMRIVDDGESTISESDADFTALVTTIREADIYKENCDDMITANRIRW